MKVFNLYFKVLRKYMGQIFMYMGIFIGLLVGIIVPQMSKNGNDNYADKKIDFAVFDYDNSDLSNALIDYLKENHNIKTIKDDSKETIQDELYAMAVQSVIRIDKGFEDSFASEDGEILPEFYAIPGTIYSVLFENDVNGFLSVVDTYLKAGFDIEDSVSKALSASQEEVPVNLIDENANKQTSGIHYYFKYLSWVFMAACIGSITTVLIALNKKGIRERVECSPYRFSRMNLEILSGVVVTGLAICAVFALVAIPVFTSDMLSIRGVLYVLNSVCIMAVALSITFLISKLTENLQVISMLSNVIGLGMAFLCGVFVPMEYLSQTVIHIAQFLPVYWNVRAIEIIDRFSIGSFTKLLTYMGIQLMYAVLISVVGIIVSKHKRMNH